MGRAIGSIEKWSINNIDASKGGNMFNFIDDNEKYQLFAEGKMCLVCSHEAHCGQSCNDEECDCFECGCINCKKQIGPVDV